MTKIIKKLDRYDNKHGTFWRPSFDYVFMSMAKMVSRRSTCSRSKVGVVITDKESQRVLCFGYNGGVRGDDNCCDSLEIGNCGCIHAELNALTKNNQDLTGATCYVTLSPCKMCAKVLINRGISKIVYLEDYRLDEGLVLLRKHGVNVVKYPDD